MLANIVILALVALVFCVFGFLIWYSTPTRRIQRYEKEKAAFRETGTPGDAKIIEVGASEAQGMMQVALRLEITPQFGAPFKAITIWEIEPAHMPEIQAGRLIPVKIVDRWPGKSKIEKYKGIFPDVAWADLLYYFVAFTEDTMKNMTYE